ncbi:hypothetical protein EWM64_g8452 [Hericium alpestre]|uniref:Uncharacterized protein n=1 Tax=Hericium alpestre TaxID=135208 RepID=A0A4Y9ZMT7_9AGAM|nr:hypothetical protein EWM64_g8452 [Hericium alpestre]
MLRRLYLKDVFVSWSAPFLRGLTYLHFEEDNYYSGESQIRDSDFFRALEMMPALETLYLAGVLPPSPGGCNTDNRAVRLPHLRSLTLISEAPQCLHVFKQLDIPSSCWVRIQCVDPDDQDLNDFLPRLCRQFPATVDPFHTLSFVYDSHDDITIGLKLWRASSVATSGVFRPLQHPDLLSKTEWRPAGNPARAAGN